MPYVCKVTSVTVWLVENSRLITSWTMKWKLGQRRHPLFESEVSAGPLSSYDDLTADLICLCRFHAPSSLFSINGAAAVCPWYHFHRLRLSCSAEDCTYSDSYHHTEPCHSCPFFFPWSLFFPQVRVFLLSVQMAKICLLWQNSAADDESFISSWK